MEGSPKNYAGSLKKAAKIIRKQSSVTCIERLVGDHCHSGINKAILLANMDRVLAKSDIHIASRYAELVTDHQPPRTDLHHIQREHQRTVARLPAITRHTELLAANPFLAQSLRNRVLTSTRSITFRPKL
jgi:phosphoenolpyruvate carboxylase